jgi:hypothetical protein
VICYLHCYCLALSSQRYIFRVGDIAEERMARGASSVTLNSTASELDLEMRTMDNGAYVTDGEILTVGKHQPTSSNKRERKEIGWLTFSIEPAIQYPNHITS